MGQKRMVILSGMYSSEVFSIMAGYKDAGQWHLLFLPGSSLQLIPALQSAWACSSFQWVISDACWSMTDASEFAAQHCSREL